MTVEQSSRRVPTAQAATPDEVRTAIETLAPADLLRLRAFAAWRVRGLGRKDGGRTSDDLLHEAIRSTLDGTRSWNKTKVDFMRYLLGAMQSISDNWRRRAHPSEPVLESQLTREGDGASPAVLSDVASSAPSPEQQISAREHLDHVRSLFEADPLANLIVCELEEGAKLPEIREQYAIKENDFHSALKRIRRRVARLKEAEDA